MRQYNPATAGKQTELAEDDCRKDVLKAVDDALAWLRKSAQGNPMRPSEQRTEIIHAVNDALNWLGQRQPVHETSFDAPRAPFDTKGESPHSQTSNAGSWDETDPMNSVVFSTGSSLELETDTESLLSYDENFYGPPESPLEIRDEKSPLEPKEKKNGRMLDFEESERQYRQERSVQIIQPRRRKYAQLLSRFAQASPPESPPETRDERSPLEPKERKNGRMLDFGESQRQSFRFPDRQDRSEQIIQPRRGKYAQLLSQVPQTPTSIVVEHSPDDVIPSGKYSRLIRETSRPSSLPSPQITSLVTPTRVSLLAELRSNTDNLPMAHSASESLLSETDFTALAQELSDLVGSTTSSGGVMSSITQEASPRPNQQGEQHIRDTSSEKCSTENEDSDRYHHLRTSPSRVPPTILGRKGPNMLDDQRILFSFSGSDVVTKPRRIRDSSPWKSRSNKKHRGSCHCHLEPVEWSQVAASVQDALGITLLEQKESPGRTCPSAPVEQRASQSCRDGVPEEGSPYEYCASSTENSIHDKSSGRDTQTKANAWPSSSLLESMVSALCGRAPGITIDEETRIRYNAAVEDSRRRRENEMAVKTRIQDEKIEIIHVEDSFDQGDVFRYGEVEGIVFASRRDNKFNDIRTPWWRRDEWNNNELEPGNQRSSLGYNASAHTEGNFAFGPKPSEIIVIYEPEEYSSYCGQKGDPTLLPLGVNNSHIIQTDGPNVTTLSERASEENSIQAYPPTPPVDPNVDPNVTALSERASEEDSVLTDPPTPPVGVNNSHIIQTDGPNVTVLSERASEENSVRADPPTPSVGVNNSYIIQTDGPNVTTLSERASEENSIRADPPTLSGGASEENSIRADPPTLSEQASEENSIRADPSGRDVESAYERFSSLQVLSAPNEAQNAEEIQVSEGSPNNTMTDREAQLDVGVEDDTTTAGSELSSVASPDMLQSQGDNSRGRSVLQARPSKANDTFATGPLEKGCGFGTESTLLSPSRRRSGENRSKLLINGGFDPTFEFSGRGRRGRLIALKEAVHVAKERVDSRMSALVRPPYRRPVGGNKAAEERIEERIAERSERMSDGSGVLLFKPTINVFGNAAANEAVSLLTGGVRGSEHAREGKIGRCRARDNGDETQADVQPGRVSAPETKTFPSDRRLTLDSEVERHAEQLDATLSRLREALAVPPAPTKKLYNSDEDDGMARELQQLGKSEKELREELMAVQRRSAERRWQADLIGLPSSTRVQNPEVIDVTMIGEDDAADQNDKVSASGRPLTTSLKSTPEKPVLSHSGEVVQELRARDDIKEEIEVIVVEDSFLSAESFSFSEMTAGKVIVSPTAAQTSSQYEDERPRNEVQQFDETSVREELGAPEQQQSRQEALLEYPDQIASASSLGCSSPQRQLDELRNGDFGSTAPCEHGDDDPKEPTKSSLTDNIECGDVETSEQGSALTAYRTRSSIFLSAESFSFSETTGKVFISPTSAGTSFQYEDEDEKAVDEVRQCGEISVLDEVGAPEQQQSKKAVFRTDPHQSPLAMASKHGYSSPQRQLDELRSMDSGSAAPNTHGDDDPTEPAKRSLTFDVPRGDVETSEHWSALAAYRKRRSMFLSAESISSLRTTGKVFSSPTSAGTNFRGEDEDEKAMDEVEQSDEIPLREEVGGPEQKQSKQEVFGTYPNQHPPAMVSKHGYSSPERELDELRNMDSGSAAPYKHGDDNPTETTKRFLAPVIAWEDVETLAPKAGLAPDKNHRYTSPQTCPTLKIPSEGKEGSPGTQTTLWAAQNMGGEEQGVTSIPSAEVLHPTGRDSAARCDEENQVSPGRTTPGGSSAGVSRWESSTDEQSWPNVYPANLFLDVRPTPVPLKLVKSPDAGVGNLRRPRWSKTKEQHNQDRRSTSGPCETRSRGSSGDTISKMSLESIPSSEAEQRLVQIRSAGQLHKDANETRNCPSEGDRHNASSASCRISPEECGTSSTETKSQLPPLDLRTPPPDRPIRGNGSSSSVMSRNSLESIASSVAEERLRTLRVTGPHRQNSYDNHHPFIEGDKSVSSISHSCRTSFDETNGEGEIASARIKSELPPPDSRATPHDRLTGGGGSSSRASLKRMEIIVPNGTEEADKTRDNFGDTPKDAHEGSNVSSSMYHTPTESSQNDGLRLESSSDTDGSMDWNRFPPSLFVDAQPTTVPCRRALPVTLEGGNVGSPRGSRFLRLRKLRSKSKSRSLKPRVLSPVSLSTTLTRSIASGRTSSFGRESSTRGHNPSPEVSPLPSDTAASRRPGAKKEKKKLHEPSFPDRMKNLASSVPKVAKSRIQTCALPGSLLWEAIAEESEDGLSHALE